MKFRYVRKKVRNQEGAISAVLMIVLVLVVVIGAAFSFDYGNGLVVKENLQNATDAGALAGAIELARDQVKNDDKTRAENYALSVASLNKAGNEAVSSATAGTSVNVSMSPNTMPRTVTVTATKTTGNIFARLIGWNSMPVSSRSTASVSQGITQVKPNQLMPLAVSLDHRPSKGPQKNKALQDVVGNGQPFTIVLNPQNETNGAWLKNWSGKQNPLLTFGQDQLITNGVKASLVKDLSPGDRMNIPIMTGGPPFNKSRTIVGVIGFEVTKINFPQEIEGTIIEPLILDGTPGEPILSDVDQSGLNFLKNNAAWTISLTD
ncbi:MAG: hypothetical protein H6677_10315 [Candidatus Obscuribacterales bacterium]|nr:hypothetical protein [Candidatus Obscuribacterales bacterium]